MSKESGCKTSESDCSANKLKVGEIYLLKDHSQILNCIQCLGEFQHFNEFTLHIQEHYFHGEIVPFHQKIETEFEEVLVKIETEQDFQNDDGLSGDYAESEELCGPVDELLAFTAEQIETKPNITDELMIDETKKLTCDICGWVSKQKKHLNSHIKTHSDNRVGCKICGKNITANNLKEHIKNHSSTPDFLCAVCGMRFTKKGALKLHLITHNPDFKYQCEFCSEKYARSDKLLHHIRTSHEAHIKFRCSSCNLGFMSKKSMIRHENIHLTKPNEKVKEEIKKEFNCSVCDVSYKTKKGLLAHKHSHLRKAYMEMDAKFHCSICNLKFKFKHSLARHVLRKHQVTFKPSIAKKIPCEYCSKEIYENVMNKHVNTHNVNAKKDFSCATCGKTFTLKAVLRQHLRTHEKLTSQPLKAPCNHCGKEVYAKNMGQHVKIHTAKKDFICLICGKGFTRNQLLVQHLITHERSFKYKCDFCSEKFLRYGKLLEHLRNDHAEEMKYHCSTCKMGFMHEASLRAHEQKHLT